MAKLSGKIAVVTGGTGALGRCVTGHFLKEGAVVIATHTGKSESLRQAPLSNGAVYIPVDVTDERSVEIFFDRMQSEYGRIDILCNLVGGILPKKNIEETTLEEWDAMVRLNLTSSFLMTRGVLRSMKSAGFGRIINISAMPAVTPEARRGGYGVAKAGVITLTKTAAEEVKESGDVTVNVIAPSIILTEENKRWGTPDDMKKWVTPDQIAEMIVHLCSEAGGAINGEIIHMYGKV
jgi:NAD(P)-dependent dehydrogenase (short-subunit alcohol dehydrogenase family)